MTSLSKLGTCLVGLGATLVGCNSFDEPLSEGPREIRVIPEDQREPVRAESTPLPVSGGTLLQLVSTADTLSAPGAARPELAVSDPARDQVSLISGGASLLNAAVVALEPGSEPGRMAQLDDSTIAVVLRGRGEVVAIDTNTRAERWRSSVCSAPRGIAFDTIQARVLVACADGELVTLSAASGELDKRLFLDTDLRDVVVADNRWYVSRFRSAEVLFVEQEQLVRRVQLPRTRVVGSVERNMDAVVAWRMLASPTGGGVLVVHQRATTDDVPIDAEGHPDQNGGGGTPYGGDSSTCDGIVQSAVTHVNAQAALSTTASLAGVTLAVDLSISPSGLEFAIADAGLRDPEMPRPQVHVRGDDGSSGAFARAELALGGVRTFAMAELQPVEGDMPQVDCTPGNVGQFDLPRPSTAVAFFGEALIAQEQTPNLLQALGRDEGGVGSLRLQGPDLTDTGHEIFHRSSGGGLACASCHPEGGDDGFVWRFAGLGKRRTQNLAVGLAQSQPFHWDGSLPNLRSLMTEVFIGRMGGVSESPERLATLEDWLFSAPKPVLTGTKNEAAERGRRLFESSEVGCATCHNGAVLTDNLSHDVGTGEMLQTPSLIGLGARPPYLHDGCAKTLLERFDPDCGGGDKHGQTSHLSEGELGDLVAYLASL